MEGSVRKMGGRVRVTAQLLDGATAICAWARHYDRDVRDIFALQEALSRDIAEALRLNLLPGELETLAERPTASVESSEEHTSELQSLMRIAYAVFCLKKTKYSTY